MTAHAMNEMADSTVHTLTIPNIPCLLAFRAAGIHPAPKQAVKNAICQSDIVSPPLSGRTLYGRHDVIAGTGDCDRPAGERGQVLVNRLGGLSLCRQSPLAQAVPATPPAGTRVYPTAGERAVKGPVLSRLPGPAVDMRHDAYLGYLLGEDRRQASGHLEPSRGQGGM